MLNFARRGAVTRRVFYRMSQKIEFLIFVLP